MIMTALKRCRFFLCMSVILLCGASSFQVALGARVSDVSQEIFRASRLAQQGDFKGAEQMLLAIRPEHSSPELLRQIISLQLRVAHLDKLPETLERIREELLGHWDQPRESLDFQLLAFCAQAYEALDEHAQAQMIWARVQGAAKSPTQAHFLFQAYRQVKKMDEACELAQASRLAFNQPGLWALELSSIYEKQSQIQKSMSELFIFQQEKGGSLATQRALRLLEKNPQGQDFYHEIYQRAVQSLAQERKRFRSGKPPELQTAQMCLSIFRQFRKDDLAIQLAWLMDFDESGAMPFKLAETFIQDDREQSALPLLQSLSDQRKPLVHYAGFQIAYARALAGTQRLSESVLAYQACAELKSEFALVAHIEAADLLDYKLRDHSAALVELEKARVLSPRHRTVGLHSLDLLLALQRFEEAKALDQSLMQIIRAGDKLSLDLAVLRVRMYWFQGDLTKAALELKTLLGMQMEHAVYNDCLEWMDLFSFAQSDSTGLVLVARADALQRLGKTREAMRLLEDADTQGMGEWLQWRACHYAHEGAAPQVALDSFDRFRQAYLDSYRLDLLDYMACQQRAKLHPAYELPCLESFLRDWPESLLIEQVRSRLSVLRGLDGLDEAGDLTHD
jgi:hypothetical protein